MKEPIVHVNFSCGTYLARGKMGRCSCTAGEAEAALRYARKWYGERVRVERAQAHDTMSRCTHHQGSEGSAFRAAYRILPR